MSPQARKALKDFQEIYEQIPKFLLTKLTVPEFEEYQRLRRVADKFEKRFRETE